MNKQELVNQISARTGFSKRSSETALNITLDTIQETLIAGDKVQLVGFGSFEVTLRKSRKAKNPRTKEIIILPEKRVVKFRPGTPLKRSVQ